MTSEDAPVQGAAALLALIFGLAQPAALLADEAWLAPDAFRDWTEGRVIRTLHPDGRTIFGHEEFGPDGSVIWQYPGGACLFGRWQPVGDTVCYDYEGVPARSCLRYRVESGGLAGIQWDVTQDRADWRRAGVRLRRSDIGALDCAEAPVG